MSAATTPDFRLSPGGEAGTHGLTLRDALELSWKSRWLIFGLMLLFTLGGLLHVAATQPNYRSDALVQVNQQAGMSALSDFNQLASFLQKAPSLDIEQEILRSRAVLGKVVDHLNLAIIASPETDFLNTLRQYYQKVEPTSITVERLTVPDGLLGTTFTLVSRGGGSFSIFDEDENLLGEGVVGEPLTAWLPTTKPHELLVADLKGTPGTRFEIVRQPRPRAIDALKSALLVNALTGSDSRGTAGQPAIGLLQISLEGHDPDRIAAVLNETLRTYMQKHAERRSAELEGTLQQLATQLPYLKEKLEQTEVQLVDYRTQRGSVAVPLHAETLLSTMVSVDTELEELKIARDALSGRFTPRFSGRQNEFAGLQSQISSLQQRKDELESQLNSLPATEQGILRLTRDLEVQQHLYTSLLNTQQQLLLLHSTSKGLVQVVDEASLPYKPMGPHKALLVAVYPLLGMMLAFGVIFLRRSLLESNVEDPEVIEKRLGLPVYAVVQHSPTQDRISRRFSRGHKSDLLSASHPNDVAVESVRSLRTWLNFAFLEAKNNILLITGPGPGVGKSFVTANLGYVWAHAGKKVLIIDADMRKGHLNRFFGLDQTPGLSQLIEDRLRPIEAPQVSGTPNLHVLPTGPVPSHPSELLEDIRFRKILQTFGQMFDYVLVDSPPILSVTDAAAIGRHTAGALLVVRADAHPLRDLERSVKTLRHLGTDVLGVVLNDMDCRSRYGYGYGYGKYYGYGQAY